MTVIVRQIKKEPDFPKKSISSAVSETSIQPIHVFFLAKTAQPVRLVKIWKVSFGQSAATVKILSSHFNLSPGKYRSIAKTDAISPFFLLDENWKLDNFQPILFFRFQKQLDFIGILLCES